ncbi:MAG: class I SAM-dependent methyltransferase [Bythopirellula sp.]
MSTLTVEKKTQIASAYEQMFRRANTALPENDDQWEFVKRHLPEDHEATVLDAGCGNGKYTRAILQAGYRDTLALDLFESNLESGIDASRYVCASVAATPFAEEAFDLICSLSVIFYLDDPADALREYQRLLKPGGKVIISCHTKYSLFTLERIVKRRLKLSSAQHLEHVRFLSAIRYQQMLQEAGFEVIEVDGFRASYLWTQLGRVFRRVGLPIRNRARTKPRSRLIGMIRATFGYHAVLIARKPDSNDDARVGRRPAMTNPGS